MIKITVDKHEIEVKEGITLLDACLDNGIYIPNLCYLKEMQEPPASCRMCIVEIDGKNGPVWSCSEKVYEGMVVKTDTPEIRSLQKTAFELLISVHLVECKVCPSNKKCPLQKISQFLKVPLRAKRIGKLERNIKIEDDHPYIIHNPFRCILCGKCIYTCEKRHGRRYLTSINRGMNTIISFIGEKDPGKIPCAGCYACVDACPVSALIKK